VEELVDHPRNFLCPVKGVSAEKSVKFGKQIVQLTLAAEMNLRASGSHAAANVIKDVTFTTPT
jgi:hypothetical protein